ncbi:MAG: hypothetical protein AAF740_10320 [Bacteroidota bacterium]
MKSQQLADATEYAIFEKDFVWHVLKIEQSGNPRPEPLHRVINFDLILKSDFIKTGEEMRTAQNSYRASNDYKLREKSQKLEDQFDNLIKKLKKAALKRPKPSLFEQDNKLNLGLEKKNECQKAVQDFVKSEIGDLEHLTIHKIAQFAEMWAGKQNAALKKELKEAKEASEEYWDKLKKTSDRMHQKQENHANI